MRFCVVQLKGSEEPVLAVEREGGLSAVSARPSLRLALDDHGPEDLIELAGRDVGETIPLDQVTRWHPPVPDPRTFRDFYAFEQHVKTCRAKRGQEMVPQWYEMPVFYFSNPCTLKGHEEEVEKPQTTCELDFELEIGCVIGSPIRDASPEAAEEAIFGYFVLNDFSARDLQREEMKCMLGPAKGKDFATAIGPWVVTKDELEDRRVGPGRYDLTMTASKNGREISQGNMKSLTHDFAKMIERASRDAPLFPGDLIGSGTVGTGCILELGPENTDGWLTPGDVIELEIERLGLLSNRIV